MDKFGRFLNLLLGTWYARLAWDVFLVAATLVSTWLVPGSSWAWAWFWVGCIAVIYAVGELAIRAKKRRRSSTYTCSCSHTFYSHDSPKTCLLCGCDDYDGNVPPGGERE